MKKVKSILALLMAFVMLMSFAVTGSAATVAEETENNGTSNTADAFGFGTEIKGALGDATDVDWYSFTNDAAGLAYVTLKHDEIADANKDLAYFEILIYESTATKVLATFRSTGAQKTSVSPTFAIDAGATYYIVVKMGTIHSETLGYSLIASFDKGAYTEKEPNNQAATATALELSTKGDAKHYYGSISKDDVDWYKIVPKSKGVVYVYLYNGSTPADFKATLYSHDETTDGRLKQQELTSVSIDSNKTDIMSVAIGVDAKEYMLKVEGVNGNIGGYRTRVYFEAASDAESEYNNEQEFATSIEVGKSLRGTISQSSDVDYFKFKASSKENEGHKITFGSYNTASKADGSWYITVIDAATKDYVSDIYRKEVKPGAAVDFSTEVLVADRYYYVVVEKGGTLNTEIYKLGVAIIEPENDGSDDNEGDFAEQIKAYWNQFWKNFEGWFEQINIKGIIENMLPGIVSALPTLFTWIVSLFG